MITSLDGYAEAAEGDLATEVEWAILGSNQ